MPAVKRTSKKTTTKVTKKTVVRKAKTTVRPAKKAEGLTVDVLDIKGKVAGTVTLPKEVFGATVNPTLMAQAVRVYLANQRKGTASTKTRGEITASTKKIWRQKGTGRARHGAVSAPIFVGGGIAFGPKPRDYSLHLPKKMKRKALASALTSKLHDGAIKFVDGLEKVEPKTKRMYETITAVIADGKGRNLAKTLLVIPEKVESVERSARNIEGITIRPVNLLNAYEVLRSKTLIFMKDAAAKMEETWKKHAS